MKSTTNKILLVLHVLTWVAFIGLCIKAGALLFSFFISLAINPGAARDLYLGLNLYGLYQYSPEHYSFLGSVMILVAALKAFIFYLLIKVFLEINIHHPFSKPVARWISRISYTALAVGVISIAVTAYTDWLEKQGVTLPDLGGFTGAGAEFLFFAGVIYCIVQVYRKGIEIQSENELTV